jgi:hypothetical protein
MIQKLVTPIKFDSDSDWVVIARDGEKFYVAKEDDISDFNTLDGELLEIITTPLLQWAITIDYPLKKFVRLQRMLTQKFLDS